MPEVDLSKYQNVKPLSTYYDVQTIQPLVCDEVQNMNISQDEKLKYLSKIQSQYQNQLNRVVHNLRINDNAGEDLYRPLYNYYIAQRNNCVVCRNKIRLGVKSKSVSLDNLIERPKALDIIKKEQEKIEKEKKEQADKVKEQIEKVEKKVPLKKDSPKKVVEKINNIDDEVKDKILKVIEENEKSIEKSEVKTNKRLELLIALGIFIGLANVFKK
jgi:uncharacterized Zn finger protein (UPF0148 family)